MIPDVSHSLTVPSLSELHAVTLSDRNECLLEAAMSPVACASLGLRCILRRQTTELLALSQVVPHRVVVDWLDVSVAGLRAVFTFVDVPLLVKRPAESRVAVHQGVSIGLTWPSAALADSLSGASFIHLRHCEFAWHPNIAYRSPGPFSAVCLGARLPVQFPVRELIIMTWGLLTLQLRPTVDERDAAGVLNPAACEWLRAWLPAHPALIPLTAVSLLSPKRVEPSPLWENAL